MGKRKPKDCPLQLHPNGQWKKKIRGKVYYFGTNLDEALKRYANEKDRLVAGLPPLRHDGQAGLDELGNLFLDHQRKRIPLEDLEQPAYDAFERVLKRLVAILGKECRIAAQEDSS